MKNNLWVNFKFAIFFLISSLSCVFAGTYFSDEDVWVKGKVFYQQGENGRPDTVLLKTVDGDFGVMPSDTLNELINSDKFEYKEFMFGGKKMLDHDGKIKFFLNSFQEAKTGVSKTGSLTSGTTNSGLASDSHKFLNKTDTSVSDDNLLPVPKSFGHEKNEDE
ncbi:MAG: hypothetical protein HQM08_07395 [Candidatus Riflebacteria bacterium]|nr:hypothetical protein [Candidatus Riflebacteria bacterium]